METLRATAFTSLSNSSNTSFSDSQLSSLPSATATYTISDYPSYTGMKELIVDVNWNDGVAKNYELKTLAGNGGINP